MQECWRAPIALHMEWSFCATQVSLTFTRAEKTCIWYVEMV